MNKSVLIWIVLLIVVLIAVLKMKKSNAGKMSASPEPFYHFTLNKLDGGAVTLADVKGSILIVDVWDTWCPPCKMEIPDFIDLYAAYRDKGLEIIGVAVGREGIDAVREFVRENGVNYPNAMATSEFLAGVGGVRGIPTTFVIDRQGNLVRKYVGFTPKKTFEQDIFALSGL